MKSKEFAKIVILMDEALRMIHNCMTLYLDLTTLLNNANREILIKLNKGCRLCGKEMKKDYDGICEECFDKELNNL